MKRGQPFEDAIKVMHQAWANLRIAHISRCHVHATINAHGKLVYTQKQGFDCQGTGPGGASVCVELKSTTTSRRLPLDTSPKGSGIKPHQAQALIEHGQLGAWAMVLWFLHAEHKARIIPWWHIENAINDRKSSFTWNELAEWHAPNCDYLRAWERLGKE